MSATVYEKIGIAMMFADKLKEALTFAEFEQMLTRNKEDQWDSPVCHSHDFCDANMVMAEAWQDFFGQEPDLDNDYEIETWNEAWIIAKAASFFIA